TDTFTYTAQDGHGDAATGTATVTITVPAESVTAHNASATITEDGIATLTPTALTVDGDDVSSSYALVGANGGATLGTVVDSNGTFTYTPTAANFETLSAGTTLTDTFTYTAADGHGDAATGTATVTITVPAESVTAHNASATITEDGIATLTPLALTV